MRRSRHVAAGLAALLLILGMLLPAAALQSPEQRTTTVLFTHDLHSHFLPTPTADGGQTGGYARLATVLKQQREKYPNALTLDAGDFSVGSLFQSLYTTQGAELRTMGMLGYDATTPGNHEFDHAGRGFGEMLNAASEAYKATWGALFSSQHSAIGEYEQQYGPLTMRLPAIVDANYWPAESNPDESFIREAMESYGVNDTLLLERGGVTYGIFGLTGQDAHDCAPTSGFALRDKTLAAQACVDALKEQGAQFIICLSHGGTDSDPDKSEDGQLAKAVDGIDLIVSGHTHTTLEQPVVVGDTYIVSCGQYGENLGSITLNWNEYGGKTLVEYDLIPIDQTVEEDPDIAALVEEWKGRVSEGYLAGYGLTYDQVLTRSDFNLNTPESGVQKGSNLGELVSDAFLWAVGHLEADAPDVKTVTVTADGVLRASLPKGDITTSMAFDVLSMGVGSDGTSGFPLVAVYLTGRELKAAAEVDASVTPIMPAAQLYMSGMAYCFNTNRMFFNRVTSAWLEEPVFDTGLTRRGLTEIEDDQLYRVVTGMYSAQMLGTVKSKSMGLLSLEPKVADGSPVTDFNACILRDENGNEIKEWYALAAYLQSFGENGVPPYYCYPDGRKSVSSSLNPAELLKNPNWITLTVLGILLAVIILVVNVVRIVMLRRRRKRNSRG
ncbi:MAG: bifunctional metallophosphatase/5'-nucleotidase [Oscillospiraceae bacterium]|nr:bifunctional metallophosphatase/5'-nucleotidase [Oscillospiraceae bacterium]